jgi:hypothetical protein
MPDVYYHPEQEGHSASIFTTIHDIYALRVLLLEIGLWEPAINLKKVIVAGASNAYEVQSLLIKHAQKHLEHRVGRKYKEVVIKCLTGNFDVMDDTNEDLKLQQAFRTQVVDALEMASNYV